jgi:hypothetical protein
MVQFQARGEGPVNAGLSAAIAPAGASTPEPSAAAADPRMQNALVLERELAWLGRLVDAGIRLYLGQECAVEDVRLLAPPNLAGCESPYASVVSGHRLSFDERAVLSLALAPHIRPRLLDPFLVKNPNFERGFTEFGGVLAGGHSGFWPTVETAAFMLAGENLERRFAVQALFDPAAVLRSECLLQLNDSAAIPSLSTSPLIIGRDTVARLTLGCRHRPAFGGDFPARRLVATLDWCDLVLPDAILEEVEEIRAWIEHRHTLLIDWRLDRQLKPGFRSLFYGPPGTGKTLTASLLGKSTGLDVYRIDLSLVVSKWVGDTEKNLAAVFDQAQQQEWILFFDEADALFGKRTQTASAHDRYANQEVAYLLQRIEEFPGIVILATNLKGNIDEAFARRFQSMVYFPVPGPEERLRLWRGAFCERARLDPAVDLARLAQDFEITGGGIANVLRYASLMALRKHGGTIRLQDITQGIRREFRKDGKVT